MGGLDIMASSGFAFGDTHLMVPIGIHMVLANGGGRC